MPCSDHRHIAVLFASHIDTRNCRPGIETMMKHQMPVAQRGKPHLWVRSCDNPCQRRGARGGKRLTKKPLADFVQKGMRKVRISVQTKTTTGFGLASLCKPLQRCAGERFRSMSNRHKPCKTVATTCVCSEQIMIPAKHPNNFSIPETVVAAYPVHSMVAIIM